MPQFDPPMILNKFYEVHDEFLTVILAKMNLCRLGYVHDNDLTIMIIYDVDDDDDVNSP